jgi:hypothetical protein
MARAFEKTGISAQLSRQCAQLKFAADLRLLQIAWFGMG